MILRGDSLEEWLLKLANLKMTLLKGYSRYETKFEEIWGLWVALLGEGCTARRGHRDT